uniref:Uncharacterized protein n=1 Tax=Rhizophora mucronata TaxID=61149 RepID=A0A2P2QLB8_RHIMU
MTLHDDIDPNLENSSLSFSSLILSSRFFKYKLAPFSFSYLLIRSCSNLAFNSASLSAFLWALPTYKTLSSSKESPFNFSTAVEAESGFSKFTKPKHLDFPLWSFIITALVMVP